MGLAFGRSAQERGAGSLEHLPEDGCPSVSGLGIPCFSCPDIGTAVDSGCPLSAPALPFGAGAWPPASAAPCMVRSRPTRSGLPGSTQAARRGTARLLPRGHAGGWRRHLAAPPRAVLGPRLLRCPRVGRARGPPRGSLSQRVMLPRHPCRGAAHSNLHVAWLAQIAATPDTAGTMESKHSLQGAAAPTDRAFDSEVGMRGHLFSDWCEALIFR